MSRAYLKWRSHALLTPLLFPQLAGTAAGLAGSIQGFIAFTSTSILAALLFLGVISMSVTIVLMALSGLLVFQICQRGSK